VLERLEETIKGVDDPFKKLHLFIDNHLSFFAANMAEMKVLSHEAESLEGEMHRHVSTKKDRYARRARKILREIQDQRRQEPIDLTVATYALFGMLNWIYNWYDPRGKLSVNQLTDNIARLFLNGFLSSSAETFSITSERTNEKVNVWRTA